MKLKPPIGIEPTTIDTWQSQRAVELNKAILRYANDLRHIPVSWVEEYNDLIEVMK